MRSPASTVLLWEDAVRVVYLCAHCGRPLANWPAQAQAAPTATRARVWTQAL